MGLPFKDVDDGLALMYLIGNDQIDLLGVTTTFGNSDIDQVYQATSKLFNDLGLTNIPLIKGAGKGCDRKSEAAAFLVAMVNQYPHEITILATGSLTNLYGAYCIDPHFYKKVKEIVLMGGVTKPLIINGLQLDELNFSVDSEASHNVLHSGAKITTMTGHICLQAEFRKEEYERLMENEDIASYAYIKKQSYAWYENFRELFSTEGFFNWDTVSSVYVTNPELFEENVQTVISSEEDLRKGLLRIEDRKERGSMINIPTVIKDVERFNEIVFHAWKNVKIKAI